MSVLLDGEESDMIFIDHASAEMSVSALASLISSSCEKHWCCSGRFRLDPIRPGGCVDRKRAAPLDRAV